MKFSILKKYGSAVLVGDLISEEKHLWVHWGWNTRANCLALVFVYPDDTPSVVDFHLSIASPYLDGRELPNCRPQDDLINEVNSFNNFVARTQGSNHSPSFPGSHNPGSHQCVTGRQR